MRTLILFLSAMLMITPFTSFAGDDYTITITNQMKDELLAPGKSIKIKVSGGKSNVVRVIAMVAPTKVPDNYVSGLIVLGMDSRPTTLDRYDIGHDEGRKTTELVSAGAVLVTVN